MVSAVYRALTARGVACAVRLTLASIPGEPPGKKGEDRQTDAEKPVHHGRIVKRTGANGRSSFTVEVAREESGVA